MLTPMLIPDIWKGGLQMYKAIILLSGGLDSTVLLNHLVTQEIYPVDNIMALTLYYGQKHKREIEAAKDVCNHLGIKNHIIKELPMIFSGYGSTLVDDDKPNVELTYEEAQKISDISPAYVPFRNGNLLAAATTISLVQKANHLFIATHKGDTGIEGGYVYPDCTYEFNKAMAEAISFGTNGKVELLVPFQFMTKAEIVKIGIMDNAPFHLTWSCYNGREHQCGKCSTCLERINAFTENNEIDPVIYMTDIR